MSNILVVGSLNLDMVVKTPVIPRVGETVLGYEVKYIPGGKGANQAVAAARLGASTVMLGAIGNDDNGRVIRESLDGAGADTSRLRVVPDAVSGLALICVEDAGNNNIVVIPGTNNDCTCEYLKENDDRFSWCDVIMLQMEIPFESTLQAARWGRELGKIVMANIAPVPPHGCDGLYPLCDYISVNESELEKLTGSAVDSIDEILAACDLIRGRGVKNVLVTLGSRGALLHNAQGHVMLAPPDVKVVDTTAAGDTFTAAFMLEMCHTGDIESAIAYANAAASLAVSRMGAQSSIPDADEVRRFMQKHEAIYV